MVADDDDALRFLILSRLVDDGHQVVDVATGRHVLAVMDSARNGTLAPFDLLLIDQRMPGLTGLEVVRILQGRGNRIPTILMTAFPNPALHSEAEQLQVPILAKPFSLLELSRLVRGAIHDRKSAV